MESSNKNKPDRYLIGHGRIIQQSFSKDENGIVLVKYADGTTQKIKRDYLDAEPNCEIF